MYGTVARIRVKPGMNERLLQHFQAIDTSKVPGFVSLQIYQMDADQNEYYVAGAFEDKEAYFAYSATPESDAQYRRLIELLEGEPEWHDGRAVLLRGRDR